MQSQNYSFVVRVWLESTHAHERTVLWRGSIEQVGRDYRIYFSDLNEIALFIERQINLDAPSSYLSSRMSLKYIQDSIRRLWNSLFR